MISLLNKFDDQYVIREEDVLELVLFYLRSKGLKNFINDVKCNSVEDYLASYNVLNNEININNENAWNYCYKKTDKLFQKYSIDDQYYTYYLNFYYLSIVFHEVVHAIQQKNYTEAKSSDDIYTYLYELCNILEFTNIPLYSKKHDLFPTEIEANNKGILEAYQLMNHTKLPHRECRIMYLQYLSSLLANYQRIDKYNILTPFDRLCKNNSEIDKKEVYELAIKAKLPKIERLNLGLDISTKEYNDLTKEKVKILIKNKSN